jgi:hypothetical protein
MHCSACQPPKCGILSCAVMFFMKPAPDPQSDKHSTMPAWERGRRSQPSDEDRARWLELADTALRHAPTEQVVAETEALARREQAAIKRRIRSTAEQVRRQSKSKQ